MAGDAAACVQERVPYRRVEKVAHARKDGAGDERLNHQEQDAAGDGDFLSGGAILVCSVSKVNEAIKRIIINSSEILPIPLVGRVEKLK